MYVGDFDLEFAYYTIAEKFSKNRCVFCIGLSAGMLIAYVYKDDAKLLPNNLAVNDRNGIEQTPKCHRFKDRAGKGVVERTALGVVMSMTALWRNFKLGAPASGDYSFDQLLDIVRHMDMENVLLLKGRAVAVFWKDRTEFQKVFLRSFKTLMETLERENRINGIRFNAYKPTMEIVPANMLINLDQKGTRLKEVKLELETFSLRSLFNNPWALKRGIVILGPPNTTGFGKTQFAFRLAVELAKAYCEAKRLPKENAVVVFSNTVDVAKDIKWKPGYVWILDEFSPADHAQAIHMSENMMKVLVEPNVPGSTRCRNEDLQLPAGVMRTFTGNADSPVQWCGNRVPWSEPLQRKSIVYVIDKPLVSELWRQPENHEENGDAAEDIMNALHENVGDVFDEPPAEPSIVEGLVHAMCGFFSRG